MGIIYMATNIINGKSYIGKTIQTLKQRKYNHVSYAKRGGKGIFLSALRKYGVDGFKWNVICECESSMLELRETMKIIIHNTHYIDGCGYNMTYGGEGCLGYKHNDIARKKISEDKIGEKNPMFNKTTIGFSGHTHNKNTRNSISEKGKEKWKVLSTEAREMKIRGIKNHVITIEERKKLSESLMGHESSIERNKKISESLKKYHALKKEKMLC
jgi:group I intron endonuclease